MAHFASLSLRIEAECDEKAQEAVDRIVAFLNEWNLLFIHDEVIAEIRKDKRDVASVESLLTKMPTWATGFPVVAPTSSKIEVWQDGNVEYNEDE